MMEFCHSCGTKNSGAIKGNKEFELLIDIISKHVNDPASLLMVASIQMGTFGICTKDDIAIDSMQKAQEIIASAQIIIDKKLSERVKNTLENK